MNSISQHISRIRRNKTNTNVIYNNNDKMSDTAEAKYKYDKYSPKLKQGTTGTSTGRQTPRSPRSPGSAGRTPSCRQELSSSSVAKRKKSRREARVSTQLVLNKYNTNYEALRLADSTALAFNLGKILLKLFTTSW